MIYFIQCESTHNIKIGYVKQFAEVRRDTLQTGNSGRLHLLATMAGGRGKEAQLHSLFAEHRISGEWFKPHPDLLRLVIRAGAGNALLELALAHDAPVRDE